MTGKTKPMAAPRPCFPLVDGPCEGLTVDFIAAYYSAHRDGQWHRYRYDPAIKGYHYAGETKR